MVPELIDGKYQVERQLGEGGMGAVYQARHTGTGRQVAIKVIAGDAMSKNPEVVARFEREARASGTVDSMHIVQVLDTGRDRDTDQPYMVMELLAGEDVAALIERLGPLRQDAALRIVGQALIGLDRAHQAGIIHRDIKPANIFVAERDGGVTVKVLDFGVAKMKDQYQSTDNAAHTRTGTMLG